MRSPDYRVDDALMDAAGPDAVAMHCLPAHRGEEITSEVMDGPRSIIWDQSENRLHVQKALLVEILASMSGQDALPAPGREPAAAGPRPRSTSATRTPCGGATWPRSGAGTRRRSGRYAEAAAIAPDRALPHVSIGGLLAKLDRADEALAAYRRALAIAPRDETALRGVAEVEAGRGRRTAAADALERLAEALDAGRPSRCRG